jgi:hypothetical protein
VAGRDRVRTGQVRETASHLGLPAAVSERLPRATGRAGRLLSARRSACGGTVEIGAWLAKARTGHCAALLSGEHARLVGALLDVSGCFYIAGV